MHFASSGEGYPFHIVAIWKSLLSQKIFQTDVPGYRIFLPSYLPDIMVSYPK